MIRATAFLLLLPLLAVVASPPAAFLTPFFLALAGPGFGAISTTSIVAILAATVAPIGAYLVAARQFSGKIETTEARDLWEESRSIRDWSQQRINTLNEVVARLEARVRELERENAELRKHLGGTMGGS